MKAFAYTMSIFNPMSRYAALAATPYPLDFIHLDLDGLILFVEKKAPKWGASSLAWHSCQIKSCEWVCRESLCKVKIACVCNKSWVLLPILTLLDSLVVEWKITWLIVCIWREIRALMSVWLSSFSLGKNALFIFFSSNLELQHSRKIVTTSGGGIMEWRTTNIAD